MPGELLVRYKPTGSSAKDDRQKDEEFQSM
jgi:hypothetical protein